MKKPTQKKNANRTGRRGVLIVLSLIMLVSLVSFKIYCDARYHEMANELAVLEDDYELLKNEEIRLNVALDAKADLRVIEQIATDRLGMRKIEQYQIEYVNLESEDRAEIIMAEDEGLWSGLMRNFSIILEYLQ